MIILRGGKTSARLKSRDQLPQNDSKSFADGFAREMSTLIAML